MRDIINGLLSSTGIPVPLKEIDVSVTINGFVSNIQSTSLYVNTEESPIEAIFTLPLDDQSAVYKFEADIDGRYLSAECHEKEKAKEIYHDAMAFGYTAMLLEEDESAGDIFSCKLGNLPSKAEAKIFIGFVTELDLQPDGKAKFTLPTVLNLRYSPSVGGLTPAGKARYATGNAIPQKLNFQLNVRGPQKIKGILGPNDKLNVDYSEAQKVAKVTLADEFKFDHDLNVLVEYEECNVPHIVLEKGDPLSGGLLKEDVLMVNLFLEPPAQITRTYPGEFIFIIDRSGSMEGEKMKSAKETLLLFLKSLPANCYFNVIGFGSHFESLFEEGSLIYNEENLKKAEMLQEQMEADMDGTEILGPLEHVFKQKLIDNYPRQLFVLTDGQVNNTKDIIKLAGSNSQHTRVFTIGIGQGASAALVRGLAKAGKGKEIFVTDSERLQPKVISLLQCAMQPVASDVEITWDLPSPVTRIMMPAKIPYFFFGVRQILYLLLSGTDCVDPSCVCSMTLNCKLASTPFEYKETFTFHGNTETVPSAPIHRLAAKAQIKELQFNDVPKKQIVTISKSANVISKHTAFVMVDTEGKLVNGMSVERVVPTRIRSPMRGMPHHSYDLPQLKSCCAIGPPHPVPSKSLSPMGQRVTISKSAKVSSRRTTSVMADTEEIYYDLMPEAPGMVESYASGPPPPSKTLAPKEQRVAISESAKISSRRATSVMADTEEIYYDLMPVASGIQRNMTSCSSERPQEHLPVVLRCARNAKIKACCDSDIPPPPPSMLFHSAPKEQMVTISDSSKGRKVVSTHTSFVMADAEGLLEDEEIYDDCVALSHTTYPLHGTLRSHSAASGMSRVMSCCDSGTHPLPPPTFRSLSRGAPFGFDERAKLDMKRDFDESKKRSTEQSHSEKMMDIIRLQTLHGSWSLGKDLLDLLKTKEDSLKQTIPLQNDTVVATVAVIAWLRKYHIERRDEWQMLEMKALDWLETQDLHGHTVEDLMSRVTI